MIVHFQFNPGGPFNLTRDLTKSESVKFSFRMVMIDMCNTFPYFLVKNEKVETEVPSIICPSEDGSYYKDEWLGHKTPKRFIHVAMMQSLGGDRTGSKFQKIVENFQLEIIKFYFLNLKKICLAR